MFLSLAMLRHGSSWISSFKMEIQPPLYKIFPKYLFLWNGASPDLKSEIKVLALQNQFFYFIGGLSFNYLDSIFHFIVDNLFGAAISAKLDFHFIGVEGGLSVGKIIVCIHAYNFF
jgi:hypothetical protein